MVNPLPIGVFDSGVGGLTVLRALRERLPHESFLYLGDTARLPYGTRTPATVERYALQACRALVERRIKMLVVACNTASAVAIGALEAAFDVPVIGVVEPGAAAAVAATASGRIHVLATEGTVRGAAYDRAIAARRSDAVVRSTPCPMFVALAEEGWHQGEIAEAVARRYLADLDGEDCLVLGCTHFPVLRPIIAKVAGPGVAIVDSADTTAGAVAEALGDDARREGAGSVRLLATDGRERFSRVGQHFLGQEIADAELVDL